MSETKRGFVFVIIFVTLDVVTGLLKALIREGFNSTIIRKGLYHKGAEILAGALAVSLDYAMNMYNININIALFKLYVPYIVLMEAVSIIENISIVNPSVGAFFSPFLQKIQNDKEDNSNVKGN